MMEWAQTLNEAILKYQTEDNDVLIFAKTLRNEIDEEFRFVQIQVKNTIKELLKMYLRGKYPNKHKSDIRDMLE